MAIQPEKQRFPLNRAILRRFPRRGIRNSFQPLVGPVIVIILNVAFDYPMKLAISKYDEMVKSFFADGADKTFSVCVHVGRIRNNVYMLPALGSCGAERPRCQPPQRGVAQHLRHLRKIYNTRKILRCGARGETSPL